MFLSDFRSRLCDLQTFFDYRNAQIAEAAGITVRAYQLYKSGCSEPTLSALVRIADLYGVSLDYLVGRSDDPTFTPSAGTIPFSASKD
nr:MAG TPA: helix-turn-helix protein [Caudoviricetes sp.]